MRLLGHGDGNTLVILTDAESRLIREALCEQHDQTSDGAAIDAFNRGVIRGTERIQAEFAELQKAKKTK